MDIKDIPVRVTGAGSQPLASEEQQLEYIDMPSDMQRYTAPDIPEPADVEGLTGAREAMHWLRGALAAYVPGGEPLLARLDALDAENRDLVNQILGEGEVSIAYAGPARAKTQESVLAGVWRTLYVDADDKLLHDILEVADAPHVLRIRTASRDLIRVSADDAKRPEVANALPLLIELQSRRESLQHDGSRHSLNLSLLPLSETELEFLDERLGRGPAEVLSRAYGKCQVISTTFSDVWWVRYYNSMGTPILNSLEVIDIPEVVKAAPEDLRDSAGRLDDILEPYWSDIA